jgi:hypothetical protein
VQKFNIIQYGSILSLKAARSPCRAAHGAKLAQPARVGPPTHGLSSIRLQAFFVSFFVSLSFSKNGTARVNAPSKGIQKKTADLPEKSIVGEN